MSDCDCEYGEIGEPCSCDDDEDQGYTGACDRGECNHNSCFYEQQREEQRERLKARAGQ